MPHMTAYVTECDFTDRKYAEPVLGAWCLAQGATGRWCCVMYMGPEELAAQGIVPESREAVEARLSAKYPGALLDF